MLYRNLQVPTALAARVMHCFQCAEWKPSFCQARIDTLVHIFNVYNILRIWPFRRGSTLSSLMLDNAAVHQVHCV